MTLRAAMVLIGVALVSVAVVEATRRPDRLLLAPAYLAAGLGLMAVGVWLGL